MQNASYALNYGVYMDSSCENQQHTEPTVHINNAVGARVFRLHVGGGRRCGVRYEMGGHFAIGYCGRQYKMRTLLVVLNRKL